MSAYYNEIDPFAAQWLRNLITAGLIAPGDVDERSIEDVRPDDLKGYRQCHFFAGVGVWSYALRLAGVSDDYPVWTGSCPCQPFSAAGKGSGFDDERHLWPSWFWLIQELRPAVIFGEQVSSKAADSWLELVSTDLEALGYAFGSIAFPSAGVGAPHIRDRCYFVGHSERTGLERYSRNVHHSSRWKDPVGSTTTSSVLGSVAHSDRGEFQGLPIVGLIERDWKNSGRPEVRSVLESCGDIRQLAHPRCERLEGLGLQLFEGEQGQASPEAPGDCQARSLDNPLSLRRTQGRDDNPEYDGQLSGPAIEADGPYPTNGFWRDADWLHCRDGKFRAVEPGTFPLVDGAPSRVGRLRAYGNAINAQAAKEFILAAQP